MVSADELVAAIQSDIDQFFELSEADFAAIGTLFSEIAGQPVPPPTMLQLLGLPENAPPVVTKDQFVNAIKKAVDDDDDPETYKKVFTAHNARLSNAKNVMEEIGDALKAFHNSVNGDTAKIEAFFCDLAPPPHTGKPMPPNMIQTLLRLPPGATTCPEDQLLDTFKRNLDPSDTAAALLPLIKKHTV